MGGIVRLPFKHSRLKQVAVGTGETIGAIRRADEDGLDCPNPCR